MAQIFHPGANTLSRVSLFGLMALPAVVLLAGSQITRSPFNTHVNVPIEQPVPFSHEHHVNELGIDCRYCHNSVEQSSFAGIPATQICMTCHSQIWTNSPLLEPVRQSYATNTPMRWNRVNKLPEFVYFNHSIHINRGINCNICHGAVQKMQLTEKGKPFFMSWCVDCHRHPERYVRDRADEFEIYRRAHTGEEANLPPDDQAEDRAILDGEDFQRTPAQLARGRRLVEQYHIKTKQLTDCWICHR
jgi:hypothetical protein